MISCTPSITPVTHWTPSFLWWLPAVSCPRRLLQDQDIEPPTFWLLDDLFNLQWGNWATRLSLSLFFLNLIQRISAQWDLDLKRNFHFTYKEHGRIFSEFLIGGWRTSAPPDRDKPKVSACLKGSIKPYLCLFIYIYQWTNGNVCIYLYLRTLLFHFLSIWIY